MHSPPESSSSDFTALPAKLEILSSGESESTADVILTEGKFHQVKRMFIAIVIRSNPFRDCKSAA